MNRRNPHRIVATFVVVSLVLFLVPRPVAAGATATLQGRVLASDGVTPMSGVVVTLFDKTTQTTFPSSPSDERGTFRTSAPSGTYSLVADTPEGAYLASGRVQLRDGENPPVSLTLKSQTTLRQTEPGTGTGGTAAPTTEEKKKEELAPWAKWVIVGGIVVAGLFVIDAVTEDEEAASGF